MEKKEFTKGKNAKKDNLNLKICFREWYGFFI